MPSTWALLARIGVGFAVSFVIGFERELRGSPAGDRTFALVGASTTAVSAIVFKTSPQALAGVITGIGFIGAGVVFHVENTLIRGVTTAAALFATTAIGIVLGGGHLLVGTITAFGLLIVLELRYIPGLRLLDARRYQSRFRGDDAPPKPFDKG